MISFKYITDRFGYIFEAVAITYKDVPRGLYCTAKVIHRRKSDFSFPIGDILDLAISDNGIIQYGYKVHNTIEEAIERVWIDNL